MTPSSASVPPSTPGPRSRRRRDGEHGQIIILFVLALIVIMGAAALVIDVGVLRNANQNLWNALDSGALAGVSQLPADATNASSVALQYADLNYPDGLPSSVTVGFRCVIGSVGGAPRLSDVPAVCDPGGNASWTCNSTICSSICNPDEGDTCNAIVSRARPPSPTSSARRPASIRARPRQSSRPPARGRAERNRRPPSISWSSSTGPRA